MPISTISITSRHEPIPADCWVLHIDGSAMPNPGRMAVGALLQAPSGAHYPISQALPGSGCNNEAELQALAIALEHLQRLGGRRVAVHTDSSVLLDQLLPEQRSARPVRPIARLASQFVAVRQQLAALDYVQLRWVPRHRNAQADALARAALV